MGTRPTTENRFSPEGGNPDRGVSAGKCASNPGLILTVRAAPGTSLVAPVTLDTVLSPFTAE
jgi:hypothetical protein